MTKQIKLDSLLQEVCIESGSDGSLALSSLGLSVCLVSHNLLYSGLKKAHLKMRTKYRIRKYVVPSSSGNFVDEQKRLELDGRCWPPFFLFGRRSIGAGVDFSKLDVFNLSQSLFSCYRRTIWKVLSI